MTTSRLRRSAPILVIVALFGAAASAEACSVCMGDPASKTASALNNAIFLMLGFIGMMLTGVGAFIFNLMQRAKSPMPPHQELAQSITQEPPTV